MHQHPRLSPRAASPSSTPRNPSRTNNGREGRHSRLGSEVPSYSEMEDATSRAGGGGGGGGGGGDSLVVLGPTMETRKKLDQILQNFYTKAATIILQSRIATPTVQTKDNNIKVNKWFQIETDDTDAFREELRPFKTCGGFDNRPPTMFIEVYLDTTALSRNQSLVIVDESGRQHDATEALRELNNSRPSRSQPEREPVQIILERWSVTLKDAPMDDSYDYGSTLPAVYKRCITFFRALFATAGILPATRLVKSLGKSPSARSILKVKCRVISGSTQALPDEPLALPLFSSNQKVTDTRDLGETETPAGSFTAEVTYRNDCNFRVESSEALLSERFMGDEDVFQPTLASRSKRRESRTEAGSMPTHQRHSSDIRGLQTYGSLSTFHGDAPPLGASPISALRNARNMGSDTSSPPVDSLPDRRPSTFQRPSAAIESITQARRPSLSFNPFKAGSLSGSPLTGTSVPQPSSIPHGSASPQSYSRTPGMSVLNQPRNRSSLTAGMPASLRGGPPPQDVAPSSASSSPRPAATSKYSSSFSHRRGRLSYGGTSRVDDEGGSSGKQSASSSVQPGSGVFPENSDGSSGSLPVDDDNISDFLKRLGPNNNLPNFHKPKTGDAGKKAANKFMSLKESHNALAESLTGSMLLQRSSSTSSRQIGSIPPMVGGMSISSSPGKPVSPHTPHTPAIPSRLSNNSIADYSPRFRSHALTAQPALAMSEQEETAEEGNASAAPMNIPLPTSPRLYHYGSNRRSSSVAQQRILADAEDLTDVGPYRSMSVGADDREPPSLTDLRGFGQASGHLRAERTLQPAAEITGPASSVPRASPAMQRLGASTRGGLGARTGSSSSVATGSSMERERSSRYSFQRPPAPAQGDVEDDEYPLLFDMSELGRNSEQGRKSLEEGRGGGDSGSSARRGGRWLGN